jgi:hypothetical protein
MNIFASLFVSVAVILALTLSSSTLVAAQDPEVCTICEFAVQYVDGFLQQNYTQEQIISALEAVCAALGPVGQSCDQFVVTYVPAIINYLASGVSPQAACALVGACSSSVAVADQAFKPINTLKIN